MHCLHSVPAAKALQSIRPAHTAPLHIQPRAGAIIPVVRTPTVHQVARAIRAARASRTQATVQAADRRVAHPIPMMQNHMLIRRIYTTIIPTISGITRMLKNTLIKTEHFEYWQDDEPHIMQRLASNTLVV